MPQGTVKWFNAEKGYGFHRPRRWHLSRRLCLIISDADTGALLAAERRNPDFLALHDELTAARIRPIVPVVVLAQAWRGGPQHQISRVLKACDIIPDDERTGRAAGVACAASDTTDVVGAIVVATAVRHQAPIVTSDRGDLARIADALGVKIRFFPT